jgi:hypothetical protein
MESVLYLGKYGQARKVDSPLKSSIVKDIISRAYPKQYLIKASAAT